MQRRLLTALLLSLFALASVTLTASAANYCPGDDDEPESACPGDDDEPESACPGDDDEPES
ncbi:MAG: hypothetical protein OXR73_11585 [Myxococcales bacterium]|nr:hypothetical protein [Myxococcales bacterium]